MNALRGFASRMARAATLSAVLGLAATLAWAQAGRPHDGAAVIAAGPSGSDSAPDARFQEAMLAYERNHWSLAFQRLSTLADDGHPEAARIALQMWRHGPTLYRSEFDASAEQIGRWVLKMGCAGDASGTAFQRGLQARQTR